MDIQELIQAGKAKLEAERKAREAEQAERQRQYEEKKAQEWAEFQAGTFASLPEAVHPYVEFYPGNSNVVSILIPGCVRISGHSDLENTITGYYVNIPSSIQRSFEESGYEIEYSQQGFKSDELDKALAVAADAYPKEQELLAEIEQREAEKQAAEREEAAYQAGERAFRAGESLDDNPYGPDDCRSMWEQGWQYAKGEQTADMMDDMSVAAHSEPVDDAEAERERIFALLEGDPIAMDMVRLWVDIVDCREHWHQRLDAADDWISHIQHRHDERIQNANNAAKSAQREADDIQSRLYQAEDKIADLERRLK